MNSELDLLIENMNVCLATSYAFQLKAHFFHWNVQGKQFYSLHKFFEEIYDEVHDSVDETAEKIRMIGGYAAGSFSRFQSLSRITDSVIVPSSDDMIEVLCNDNDIVISTLEKARKSAITFGKTSIVQYLEDRIAKHEKHKWMLESFKCCVSKEKELVDVSE